MFIEKINIKLR